jgi:hypothetical protein
MSGCLGLTLDEIETVRDKRNLEYGIRDIGYGIRDTEYGLRDTGYGLWITGYGLWAIYTQARQNAFSRSIAVPRTGRSGLIPRETELY